jgi:VWFA-related protein
LKPRSIRIDVNLVLIPVLVTDSFDRPVPGLTKENFRLFEGTAEQNITQFFSQDAPISIGVIMDASNSMRDRIDQARKAVSAFVQASPPGDEFFLLKFSDRPEAVQAFTTDPAAIEEGAGRVHSGGWTSLFDAIYMGMDKMRHATKTRKVLLVLSDGGDNNSRYTETEIRRLVKEADVRIFAISIINSSPTLDKISEESGGRTVRVKNLDNLPDLAAQLSVEIHSEYVLGYAPSDNQNDNKYHKVRVELTQPGGPARLRTSWKRGYYGAGQ